eukprot:TRINITY_DN7854_c0_g1_i1.p1 TRINITY_DN7854_c0_g1~~TRINITY_DN7854_c0_g1_i1.p1  ORF type:complete len:504 (+),score=97.64 TRINITY_DN7854_c0_g1_i1:90-1601(+)
MASAALKAIPTGVSGSGPTVKTPHGLSFARGAIETTDVAQVIIEPGESDAGNSVGACCGCGPAGGDGTDPKIIGKLPPLPEFNNANATTIIFPDIDAVAATKMTYDEFGRKDWSDPKPTWEPQTKSSPRAPPRGPRPPPPPREPNEEAAPVQVAITGGPPTPGQEDGMPAERGPGEEDGDLGCCGLCPGEKPESDIAVLQHTLWWCYCCCFGVGVAKALGSGYFGGNCCCFTLECEPTLASGADVDDDGFDDGVVGCVTTCCFCSEFLQMPQRLGTPGCMCCNSVVVDPPEVPKAGPGVPGAEEEPAVKAETGSMSSIVSPPSNFWDFLLYESWVPCYASVMGCACHRNFVECCDNYTKCGGLLCKFSLGVPLDFMEEGCTEGYCNNWCSFMYMRGQCRCPPLDPDQGNPIIACCGWRWRQARDYNKSWRQAKKEAEEAEANRQQAAVDKQNFMKAKAADVDQPTLEVNRLRMPPVKQVSHVPHTGLSRPPTAPSPPTQMEMS